MEIVKERVKNQVVEGVATEGVVERRAKEVEETEDREV